MKYLNALFFTALMIGGFSCYSQKTPKKADKTEDLSKYSKATFAAGCFWHEEALFESVKGVKEAVSGYAGGTTSSPSYESIETGNTGHYHLPEIFYGFY